jgi:2-iminobutanoate/2-iminopropanoate deaminase
MVKTEIKHPDKKVSTGAYSAGVLVDGWLYVSGQGPLDLATGEHQDGDRRGCPETEVCDG